ncbi:MAG: hypothetical protein KAT58_01175 [candidate division Zixibacteria bacterium]|nr:hypothetical protein [candidate division Zixibacteria bacterium]
MAKRQSFADKVGKKAQATICPVCNQPVEYVKVVDPTYAAAKSSWKFKEKLVGICKCNEKDILA